MTDNIREYVQAIESGKEKAGRWVRLFYQYIISGLDSGKFFYSEKKASKAIRCIEIFCHHCEGRSDLLKLEL